jgi:hypothetical protein
MSADMLLAVIICGRDPPSMLEIAISSTTTRGAKPMAR